MNKFMDFLNDKLVPVAGRIAANKLLSSISTGFSLVLPALIIGAIFSLFSGLQLGPYQEFITSTGIAKFLAIPPKVTTDLLSLYAVFGIAYAYTMKNGLPNDGHVAGFLALVAFFIITPITVVGEGFAAVSMLPFSWLGAAGLFMAIFVGLITGWIYSFVVNRNFTIKMPDGVPPTIAKSFSALIPGFIIAIVFLCINAFFSIAVGTDPHDWLYSLIKSPLAALSGSIWTYLFITFLSSFLWFFGLHGGMITMPFSMMLFTQAAVENQTAYMAGSDLPNIITATSMYITLLGGIGATLSLSLLMSFFAKSTRYKMLGRLSLAPALCGINEPVMFGFPMILNPIMAIPFFIVPLLDGVILYAVTNFGLVSAPRLASMAMGTPVFLDSFMLVGFAGIVLQVILIIVNGLIYYPFFKIEDNLALRDEQNKVAEAD